MLEREQRKGNPLTLLVGMQTSTATMENSMEILKKKKFCKRDKSLEDEECRGWSSEVDSDQLSND